MSNANKPPAVKIQGKAIVDTYSDGYYMMLPDGVINWYTSKKAIEKDVRAWAKKNSDANKINVCTIEYRDLRSCGPKDTA